LNTEAGLAMQSIRGKQFVPNNVATRILSKITPDMQMRPEGRQMESALRKAALDFQKPWTYEQLDAARMRARQRLNGYESGSIEKRYHDIKTDSSVIIDNAINEGIKDIVYPAMDKAAGKPQGYFGNLKERQSTLIQMESQLDKHARALATRTAKIQGGPRFGNENVSAYAHPTSMPGLSLHGLGQALHRPNPLAKANAAVARSFGGRPVPTAAIMSYPVRQLLLLPQEEPKVENRKDALTALGR
jgi:hypothetical protein